MSRPGLAERTDSKITFPRGTGSWSATDRRSTLSSDLQELADALRAQGHSVHAASVRPSSIHDLQLARCAAHFFDQVLSLAEATQSVRAHIRVYLSNGLLFLEVTQLAPRSFESATRHRAGRDRLSRLREWAEDHGHLLSIRRGPRDQLRIALMVTSVPHDRDGHDSTANGLVTTSRPHRSPCQPAWAS